MNTKPKQLDRNVTANEMIESCMMEVAAGYDGLYTLASQGSQSDFEYDIARNLKTFEEALRQYNVIMTLAKCIELKKAREAKEAKAPAPTEGVWIDEKLPPQEFKPPATDTNPTVTWSEWPGFPDLKVSIKEPELPKKLKLEDGKKYVDRDGNVFKIKEMSPSTTFPFVSDSGERYRKDGGFGFWATEHPKDLVSEYVEPEPPKPEPRRFWITTGINGNLVVSNKPVDHYLPGCEIIEVTEVIK